MSFTAHIIIFITGIVVILISARSVVKNSLCIAKVFGLSDEFIGMTVLSIGTSLPEIVTHIAASFRILREPWLINELSAISVGTNVGSDVFQQNFMLGLLALIGVVTVAKKDLLKDVGVLVITTFLVFLFSVNGTIT